MTQTVEDALKLVKLALVSIADEDDAAKSQQLAKEVLAVVEYVTVQGQVVWQPIETAPKDGTMILVCLPRQMNLVVRAWYNKVHKHWATDHETDGGITRPTWFHKGDLWHPIPTRPSTKKGTQV